MQRWLERYRAILFFLLVVVILTGLVVLQVFRPKSPTPILSGLTPASSPSPSPAPAPIRVYVHGAVTLPDVYVLPPDAIVKDAIQAAGGPSADADLDRINLAERLAAEQDVYVPRLGETQTPAPVPLKRLGATQVNINSASAEELQDLPGIGPEKALKIVEYRQSQGPFQKTEDLMEVPGIGPATFDKLRDLITTE